MSNELTDRNCDKCVHHLSGYCDSWDCNMQTVDDVKKEAVNEYIKAVVKELEQLADDSNDYMYETYFNGKEDGIREAIETVKQCGISDDVCEWKIFDNSLTDKPQWVYKTTCGKYIEEEHTLKEFVYCPYCGRKIKVVE